MITDEGTHLHAQGHGPESTSPTIRPSRAQRRELTARDYAYSIKRFLDPRNRSPYAFLFEGKIAGLDELAAHAQENRTASTTTRRSPGSRRPDRYTLRIRLNETDFNFSHLLAFSLVGRRRARSDRGVRRRHQLAPGRHRALHAEELHALVARSSSKRIPGIAARPGISRPATMPLDREIAARMKGKKTAADRARRDQHHGGDAEPLARVSRPRDRHRVSALRKSRRSS